MEATPTLGFLKRFCSSNSAAVTALPLLGGRGRSETATAGKSSMGKPGCQRCNLSSDILRGRSRFER